MQNNNGISFWWNVFLTIGAIFGVFNIVRFFRAPAKDVSEEYEEIIAEKDKIIKKLEKRIEQYQNILDHDKRNKLE